MLSALLWLLVTVTSKGALRNFIAWFPNERLVGDAVTAAIPVPPRNAICWPLAPVSETISVPAREPKANGVNVTEMVQLAPAARVDGWVGQLLTWV